MSTPAAPSDPRFHVRRRDRAVTDEAWIAAALAAAPSGVLALADELGPYAQPNLFVYAPAERAILLHSIRGGRLARAAATAPRATFVVHELGRIVRGEHASHFTAEYASVVVYGALAVLADDGDRRAALARWFAKYCPTLEAGRDYVDFTDAEMRGVDVYRLAIEGWTAKRNVQPATAPGDPAPGPSLFALPAPAGSGDEG